MADEPILKTPGELLAEAREGAGMSLAAVSEDTKIPVPQLQIIERDEYHRLSGPLYVKSFLRAYAEAVGLDVGMILDLYNRSTGEGAPSAGGGGRAEVWEQETVTITRVGVDWGRLLAWGAGGAVVVVGIWLLIRLLAGGGGRTVEPQARPEPVTKPPAAAVARDTVVTTSPPPATTPTGGGRTAETAKPAGTRPAAQDAGGAGSSGGRTETAQTAEPEPEPAPATPAESAVKPAEPEAETTPANTAATPVRTGGAAPQPRGEDLPAAFDGVGPIPFADGERWPVRVRLLTNAPLVAEAKCDGEARFRAARFAPADAGQPTQPAKGIEPGRAYAVREGIVVYWCAQDHCVLRLDRTAGVQISVNGRVRDIGSLQPGQEIVLDNFR